MQAGFGTKKIYRSKCLILKPEDWHQMKEFTEDTILMVFASENYDAEDYIFEPYS